MKKVMAVIKGRDLEKAERALRSMGVEGITVIKAKGCGEGAKAAMAARQYLLNLRKA